jgi:hypothetical protein
LQQNIGWPTGATGATGASGATEATEATEVVLRQNRRQLRKSQKLSTQQFAFEVEIVSCELKLIIMILNPIPKSPRQTRLIIFIAQSNGLTNEVSRDKCPLFLNPLDCKGVLYCVRFEVLTAARKKKAVLWVVKPCSLV